MEKIKVNKQELLGIVKQNRDKHKTEFIESIKAYRVKAAELLNQELEKIVSGEKFQISFDLQKPESHEKEYDLAIKMLEMSVDDNIVLSYNEFNELVNDEWNWKRQFRSSYMSNSSFFGMSSYGTSGLAGEVGNIGLVGLKGKSVKFADDEIL